MNKLNKLFAVIVLPFCLGNSYAQIVKPAVKDALSPATEVHLNGYWLCD
ncbi:hypothetical protein [Mucilaginibacter humi]|nr:hypothetical protein [Mucilaginibacter humi]